MLVSKEQILTWVERAKRTLSEEATADATRYALMSSTEKWLQIGAASASALAILEKSPARHALERQVEEDHRRWGRLVRIVQVRAGG